MVESLGGSDWKNIRTERESGGVYLYRFLKKGSPVWVAWNDNEGDRTLTIPAAKVKVTQLVPRFESGKDVTSYDGAFESQDLSATAGSSELRVRLGDSPVIIEQR
ncbi:MAG: hypothetical protein A3J24_00830 [Deltaproteobacteria bacterium RIFCSPLOWO2_02_FULL_53_8]|nr:MAG: hypothetical protein A3J24_00830 [Deltaproteobacteria bacterium RIFCSPLOWO2_02_FULL_53_8]